MNYTDMTEAAEEITEAYGPITIREAIVHLIGGAITNNSLHPADAIQAVREAQMLALRKADTIDRNIDTIDALQIAEWALDRHI